MADTAKTVAAPASAAPASSEPPQAAAAASIVEGMAATSIGKSTSQPSSSKPTSARTPKAGIVASKIQTLYNTVPTNIFIPTSLREMEKQVLTGLGRGGAAGKIGKHGQDACILDGVGVSGGSEEALLALEEHNEMIEKAKEAIAQKAFEKIHTGDTILIYGYSELIKEIFLYAIQNGKRFSLIIVETSASCAGGQKEDKQDSDEIHGLKIVNELGPELKKGLISVTHTHLNGLSFIIRKVTKLFLSAYALLTNGGILGRVGTAQVALMAHSKNIPVVVCCETFKFCDRSPSDSFFLNERGLLKSSQKESHSDKAASTAGPSTTVAAATGEAKMEGSAASSTTATLEESTYLKMPTLKYDITPAQLVTAVITEVDIFPATSIPLLVRVQENRNKQRAEKVSAGGTAGQTSSTGSGTGTTNSPEKPY